MEKVCVQKQKVGTDREDKRETGIEIKENADEIT